MSQSSNSIDDFLIIYNVSVISENKMMTTTKNKTEKYITTMDRFTTTEEKQIEGGIVQQIFHAILRLILKLFTPSVR